MAPTKGVAERSSVADSPLAAGDDVAVRLRMAIARLFRRIERTRAGVALTPSETTRPLAVVRQGPLRLSDLAKAEAINPTMLSRIIRDLEEAGLVRRNVDRVDRRAALAEACPAGSRDSTTGSAPNAATPCPRRSCCSRPMSNARSWPVCPCSRPSLTG